MAALDNYLLLHYRQKIITILEESDGNKHFTVNIDVFQLSNYDVNLGSKFLKDPSKSLKEWNEALARVQNSLIVNTEDTYVYKKNLHCRFHNLPPFPEFSRTTIPRKNEVNKFLQITGTVPRVKVLKLLEYQRFYICTKCKYKNSVQSIYGLKNIITPPKKCNNPEECNGTNLVKLEEISPETCKDYQEIKLQESANNLDKKTIPNFIWVTLEDDLVDVCKPGDNITVCGWIKTRFDTFIVGKKIECELVIHAHHIEVNNSTSFKAIKPELNIMFESFWKTHDHMPFVARDIILKSICPELFGLYLVKLAIAVVLAGGNSSNTDHSNIGIRVRAEPHLLLVGDPGTGKSQLLRFTSKIASRSVLTTGVGSTAAGLTVAAVMENGEWQLEAGALVMSDGGICCIDEINTMKEHDRISIHEAMEQQTISVAKAGMVCKLNSRCSIIAATNPKGNLDQNLPLNMNIALASPLLSRFDLIFLLRDVINEEYDSKAADYLLSRDNGDTSIQVTDNIHWNMETLQAYFSIIKKLQPNLTDTSNRILAAYYQSQRRKHLRNKSRTTVRLLDSLVRLSQGHARLMYHEQVEVEDAIIAIVLVETGMGSDSGILNLKFNPKDDFSLNPNEEYDKLIETVLNKLELNDLTQVKKRKNVEPEETNPKKSNTYVDEQIDVVPNKNISGPKRLDTSNDEKEVPSTSKAVDVDSSLNKNTISPKRLGTFENAPFPSTPIDIDLEIANKNVQKCDSNVREQNICDDLEALKCIPSIHDIHLDEEMNEENPIKPTINKNRFNRFKFVPREENVNISFTNVLTSTQIDYKSQSNSEACPNATIITKAEEINTNSQNLNMEEVLQIHNPRNIFEDEEDFDIDL